MDENMNPITEQAEQAQVENGGQDPVVADQETAEQQVEDTAEGGAEEGASGDGDRAESKQSHAERHAYKRMRQRAEREAEERLQADYDKQISESGAINPYTGEPFQSFEEFLKYGKRYREDQLQAQAQKQNRPVEQLRREEEDRVLANQKRREDAEKAREEKSRKKQQEFIAADAAAFMEEHPEVDLAALDKNKNFRRFCGSRYGNEPLSELYDDYIAIVGQAGAAAVAKAQSKKSRGVGGGSSAGGATLSADQQRSLEEWNRRNPDMKMTPKEFLSR